MENSLQLQFFQALVFLSAGIAAGVVYDVCRALRRCCGSRVRLWADVLYAMGICAGLFVLGMLGILAVLGWSAFCGVEALRGWLPW